MSVFAHTTTVRLICPLHGFTFHLQHKKGQWEDHLGKLISDPVVEHDCDWVMCETCYVDDPRIAQMVERHRQLIFGVH